MVCDNGEAEDNSEAENTAQPVAKPSDSRNVFEAIFNITAGSKLLPASEPPVKQPNKLVITKKPSASMDMTIYEREGLTAIVLWLEKLPQNKKCIPKDIPDPAGLLLDVKVCRMMRNGCIFLASRWITKLISSTITVHCLLVFIFN